MPEMIVEPSAPSWEEIDPFIEAYEESQGRGDVVQIGDFVPETTHPHFAAILCELIRADLEYSWERGQPRSLEHYLSVFPSLRDDAAGLRAVAFEEFRLRRQAGQNPPASDYRDRLGVCVDDWPTSSPTASDCGPGPESLERAASDYLGLGASGDETNTSESALLFADLHDTDPELANRLARAVTSLPEPGQELCGFHLIEELGRGAFGRVYLARQGDLAGRLVALKVAVDLSAEARSLARLQHSNIVPIYSFHQADLLQALCMPYFGATTLSTCRLDHGSAELPVREVLRIAARLAEGLAYAHERGILHQDLKPANVLLADDGTPMLLDFSLARDTRLHGNPAAAYVGGTLPYMAPEQLAAFGSGQVRADARSDLYSLGLIVWELLAGRPAFSMPDGSLPERLARMIADRRAGAPDVRLRNSAVTPAVASILQRCLEADPERRYQTAGQLAEDLDRHLADLPLRWSPEPSLRERVRKWTRRHPRLSSVYAVGLVALALVASFGTLYVNRSRELARAQAVNVRRDFGEELKRTRFLLGSPAPAVADVQEGIPLARQALARYGVLDGKFHKLPSGEREALAADVRELLLFLSRGERLRSLGMSPDERDERLREATRLNELAETCGTTEEGLKAVLFQRALLWDMAGRHDEARDLFQQADALPQRTARDYYLAGVEKIGVGDWRGARDLLGQARRRDPHDAFVCYALGLCYAELGDYPRAASALDTSIALWPNFAGSHHQRGRVHHELKEYDDALAEYTDALRVNPDYVPALIDRSLLRLTRKELKEAEADLTHALEIGASPTRVYFLRSDVYRHAGDKQAAERDRSEGFKSTARNEQDYVIRGLERLGDDPKEALADFDKALEYNPRSLPALEDKAHVLAEHLSRTEEAVKALDTVLEHYPERALARSGRGVLLARLGKRDEAIKDARAAERLDLRPEVLYQCAGVYALTSREKAEDSAEALRLLAAALGAGYGLDLLADDPDLRPIRALPGYRRIVESAKNLRMAGRPIGSSP
jgi:serine/threonine protein kinase/Flp pilus assembly protein TadD